MVRWLVVGVLVVGAVGCGLIEESYPDGGGRVCYLDTDCAPDGCCGMAQEAVHVLDAPDCSLVQCGPDCPLSQVRCGCGLPVCRDSRCQVAVSTEPRCL